MSWDSSKKTNGSTEAFNKNKNKHETGITCQNRII
jgi:hypothetical protein